ncbi:MAG: hypothetical protein P8Z33_14325, partial [Gammaproteobacteria bacterium]
PMAPAASGDFQKSNAPVCIGIMWETLMTLFKITIYCMRRKHESPSGDQDLPDPPSKKGNTSLSLW